MSNDVQHQVYDPRIPVDEESGKKPIVWCSKSVELAREAIFTGQQLYRSPFYEGDPTRRKGNLVFRYTDDEINEIVKCSEDIYYFIHTYCKLKQKDGKYGHFKLRNYQYQQIEYLQNNKYVIVNWSRQSGKTSGFILDTLWRLLFETEYAVAILANKAPTSGEVLSKLKNVYLGLPFFLQAGILGWNGSRIAFDNKSRIQTAPATLDALNSLSCSRILIDEFAFIGRGRNKREFQKEFLANALPVISAIENGQCIISSTPNGKDYFYDLVNGAAKGTNEFKLSTVKWYQIPGRTVEWAKREIGVIGLDKFKIQYECSFDTTTESLLDSQTMQRLERNKTTFVAADFDGFLSRFEEHLRIHPDVEIDFDNDFIIISVDIAEGLKQDYSVAQIFRLEYDENRHDLIFRQIGIWAANDVGVEEFADVTAELFNNFNPDTTKLLIEKNTYGDLFMTKMKLNVEYEVPQESILKFKRNADDVKLTKGLRVNAQIRDMAVKAFKSLMDARKYIITEDTTITEIENFQKNAKGKYAASIGHDDRVTPITNLSYFIQLGDVQYRNWIEDFMEYNGYIIDENELESLMRLNTLTDSEYDDIDESAFSDVDPTTAEYMREMLGV